MLYKSLKFLLPVVASRSFVLSFKPFNIHRSFTNSILRLSTESLQDSVQLFIGNLPLSIDEEKFANILDENGGGYSQLRLILDKNSGKPRGFGYAEFSSMESAQSLLNSMQGKEIEGRVIKVDYAPGKAVKSPPENEVFVANLSFEATKESVIDAVNSVLGPGKVVKVRFSIDKNTNRPRGFGYIAFTDPETASRALKELNGVEINGRPVRVDIPTKRDTRNSEFDYPKNDRNSQRPSFSPRENKQEDTIFLGNLSWEVDSNLLGDMLNDLLGPGQFTRIRMAQDKETGKFKGYAHIDLVDQQAVDKAMVELNGVELVGRALRVDKAKRADNREGSSRRGGEDNAF